MLDAGPWYKDASKRSPILGGEIKAEVFEAVNGVGLNIRFSVQLRV